MNHLKASYEKHLKKAHVSDDLIAQIVNAPYQERADEKQDNANYCAAVMAKCDELLDFQVTGEAMFSRSCCKSGFRLGNARMIAREHGDAGIEEKLELLGQQRWMGTPRLTENGDIYTGYCAGGSGDGTIHCSCGHLGGRRPEGGNMPASYCLCCGGHFRFHYQEALGLNLRVKQVVSSVFGDPPQYCSFLLEITGKKPKRVSKARPANVSREE